MTITVLVLVAIAIWQMTKIFELSQIKAKSGRSEIATAEDNKNNGYLMFAFRNRPVPMEGNTIPCSGGAF